MKIEIIIKNDSSKKITAESGNNLLDVLRENNIEINSDCGGNGTCGKCKVKLLKGEVDGAEKDTDGYILSCKAILKESIEISVPDINNEITENGSKLHKILKFGHLKSSHSFGVAFDLGTTTLAFSLVDLTSKKVIEHISALNKQSVFGADVITRISASNEGHLEELHKIICSQLEDAIIYFKNKYKIKDIKRVAVAGNTTMLHIFMNVSPKGIGVAPYTPEFLEYKSARGKDLNVSCDTVDVLPSCGPFVGADITSGAYLISMPKNTLLVDLGTNGELLYHGEDKYYATSTAAGPCLEGATMSCGVGGIKGAICKAKVDDKNGAVTFETISNAQPCGICGAGFIDLISCYLKNGTIEETGALKDGIKRIPIADDIFLEDSDVRKFQLAKSAILSGIETLFHEINVDLNSIDKIYLAGGIGYYVNVESAISVGLLPKIPTDKFEVVGNSSLLGAEKFLLNKGALDEMQAITDNCSIIDLNVSSYFTYAYTMHMIFE